MNTLIFDTSLTGHRLEYLHHLYKGALDRKDEEFTFILPEDFNDKKMNMEWPNSENIHIRLMTISEVAKVNSVKSLYKSSYIRCRLLMKYAKKDKYERILLISLMDYMPWLGLVRLKAHVIRGIIYKIYLYDEFRGIRKLFNTIIYKLFALRKTIDKIFLLNDEVSSKKLNSLHQTSNFYYLPDPVPTIDPNTVENIREDIGVIPSDKFYLHFGGLSERKGTLVILDAIKMMSPDELKDKVFVFAGIVNDDIRDRFYMLINVLKDKARIIVYDDFCPYSMINNLCKSCDVILIPYLTTAQSSGVIGYASYFKKPVIGPSSGLIGNLIRQYNIGLPLNTISAGSLREAICGENPFHSSEYYKTHTVSDFISTLLS